MYEYNPPKWNPGFILDIFILGAILGSTVFHTRLDRTGTPLSTSYWTLGSGLQELINDGDSFVLDAPDKVYVLDGPKASPFEKRQANETAENIERARPMQLWDVVVLFSSCLEWDMYGTCITYCEILYAKKTSNSDVEVFTKRMMSSWT